MSTDSRFRAIADNLEAAVSRPWAGEANLVGTLIDRTIVKIRNCGEHSDDAILVFLEALNGACQRSDVFAQLWKSIREDGTIDLWHYNHEERWRSVSFEIRFTQAFPTDDLYMVVSTFVPFGIDDDRTHYPIEQSTAYLRATQELRAVVNMSAKRVVRDTSQEYDSTESSNGTSSSSDVVLRSSSGSTSSASSRHSVSASNSSEVVESCRNGFFGGSYWAPSANNQRSSSGQDTTNERRSENTLSTGREQTTSERRHSDHSQRSHWSFTSDETVELSEDVNFTAVGPDFTQPDRLLAAWRADPGNAEASMAIDLVLCSFPALGQMIEHGVQHRRLASRVRSRDADYELTPEEFWAEVSKLIALHNPGAWGQRQVLQHHGYPSAIAPQAIAAAIQKTRRNLGQLTGRTPYLLE